MERSVDEHHHFGKSNNKPDRPGNEGSECFGFVRLHVDNGETSDRVNPLGSANVSKVSFSIAGLSEFRHRKRIGET